MAIQGRAKIRRQHKMSPHGTAARAHRLRGGVGETQRHDDKLTFLKSNYKYKRRAAGQRAAMPGSSQAEVRSDLDYVGDNNNNNNNVIERPKKEEEEEEGCQNHSDNFGFSIILRLFIIIAQCKLVRALRRRPTMTTATTTAQPSAIATAGAAGGVGAPNDDVNDGDAHVDGFATNDSARNCDKVSALARAAAAADTDSDSIHAAHKKQQRCGCYDRQRRGEACRAGCQQQQQQQRPRQTLSNFSMTTTTGWPRSGGKVLSIFMTLFMALALSGGRNGHGGVRYVKAGACWQTALDSGKCNEIFSLNITKTECCRRSQEFSFTDREPTSVEYFFATTIGGGMECAPCMESCRHIKCGPNKKCVKRKGRPKCICSPECGAAVRRKQQLQRRAPASLYPRDTRSLSSEMKSIDLGSAQGHPGAVQQPQLNQRRQLSILGDDGPPPTIMSAAVGLQPGNGSARPRLRITTTHVEHAEMPTTRRLQVISNVGGSGGGGGGGRHNRRRPAALAERVGSASEEKLQRRRQRKKSRTGNHHRLSGNAEVGAAAAEREAALSVEARQTNNGRIRHIHQNARQNALHVDAYAEEQQQQELSKQRQMQPKHRQQQQQQQEQERQQQQQHNRRQHEQQQPQRHYQKHRKHHPLQEEQQQQQPARPHHRQQANRPQQQHRNQQQQRERNRAKQRTPQQKPDDDSRNNNNNNNRQLATAATATGDANSGSSASVATTAFRNNGSAAMTALETPMPGNPTTIATTSRAEVVNAARAVAAAAAGCQTSTLATPVNSMSSGVALNDHQRQQQQQQQPPPEADRFLSRGSDTATSSAATVTTTALVQRGSRCPVVDDIKTTTTTTATAPAPTSDATRVHLLATTKTTTTTMTTNYNNNNNNGSSSSSSHQPNDNIVNGFVVVGGDDDVASGVASAAGGVGGAHLSALNVDDLTLLDGIYDNYNLHGFPNQQQQAARPRHQQQQKQQPAPPPQQQQQQHSLITQQRYESSTAHTPHPVCGTDGRTYNTECQLKKRACRTDNPNLLVAYHGHCRTSCYGVKCLNGLSCVEDHYSIPHCITCQISCPYDNDDDYNNDDGDDDADGDGVDDDERGVAQRHGDVKINSERQRRRDARAVCGVDGKTYRSVCDINRMICKIGRSIGVAYPGPCRADRVTCSDVNCGPKHTCLTDLLTHEPRCVSCRYKCARKRRPAAQRGEEGNICGANNRTYHSWCEMRKDSCATGFFIDVKSPGVCHQ